ncbi:pullulanase-type alpha-1,6-glucosidase [Nesterenkonia sp. HG001]|uniref:pullulanase-type alpha-1,6-glucosidase n=1 Tax=Nesterenkonia sp. HG001 TaxID=2983207 RepID=UPI002AC66E19|nr:pullulanase-type alpha-1,6-glucosidase [Nesterenkonia sp. HG001]MDZ5077432.1 pullulanase-type alpha-1,6-glucosidase [Nesterenkonia sp. HG001]
MRSTRRASLTAGLMAAALGLTAACTAAEAQVSTPETRATDQRAIDLAAQRAMWLDDRTIALDTSTTEGRSYELLISSEGDIEASGSGVDGAEEVLRLTPAGEMDEALAETNRRYAHYETFTVSRSVGATEVAPRTKDIVEALRGQLVVVESDADGAVLQATGVQTAGALDAVYADAVDEELGLTWKNSRPELAVWAPTARTVELELYSSPDAEPTVHRMTYDKKTGVWSVKGKKDWKDQFYTYRVEVWHPESGDVETHSVTDPYSVSLAADSTHSQIIDLEDPALQPEGWEELDKPEAVDPTAAQIWEVHVRDFSAADETIDEDLRGTYRAFTVSDSTSVGHLGDLAEAGLTHVHLLPTFDIGTIPEVEQRSPDCDLPGFAPDSPEQQACIGEVRADDAYNWGYDPLHFNVPEGSYATEPDGAQRILEYREMVQSLNEQGLLVVNDVVYNHTHASGLGEKSVFDRIVPGYYHRLDEAGVVERSTCCDNTAPEHAMFGKFIVESAELWAEQYRIDGMRFDLMGHHPKENILAVQEAVEEIDPGFLIYGEGWDFGEVAGDALFEQASQMNMGGTGIGTFNDRLRDAAHGGGPFDQDPRRQGFGTGLWTQDNGSGLTGDEDQQLAELLHATDLVRIGLVGNLAEYPLTTADGETVTGSELDYNGAPAGYTEQPGEAVTYVDAHDNEILFDLLAHKLDHDVTGEDRARMQAVNLSLAVLSQGTGFVTAGSELMRSKSLDRDSYDSGDWFNAIRWQCGAAQEFGDSTNGFGIGLPPAWTTEDKWPWAEETLNAVEAPTCEEIEFSRDRHLEQLQIAHSTGAFSLGSYEEVAERVAFPLQGQGESGVITMTIDMTGLDDAFEQVTVVINPTPEAVEQTVEERAGAEMALHPVLVDSVDDAFVEAGFDAATGTLTAPARATTVFVE